MDWVKRMIKLHPRPEKSVDALQAQLEATVADLKRVSLEVKETNRALTVRVDFLKRRDSD